MFIDTHCHLTEKYRGGVNDVIGRARRKNVGVIVCSTAEPDDLAVTLDIARTHKNVFCTVGFHPDCADTVNPTEFLTPEILSDDVVVGIGEIGLDYHSNKDNRENQIKLFTEQLEIARQYDLPVAIHTRDADDDTREYLTDKNHGVLHCFTSKWGLAKTMLDRGFYFSASGILTFKRADEVREVFAKIPLDRIVVETDAPYCAPVPFRGQICESFMVKKTAGVLAEIKKIPVEELENILFTNTLQLYPKIKIVEIQRPQKRNNKKKENTGTIDTGEK